MPAAILVQRAEFASFYNDHIILSSFISIFRVAIFTIIIIRAIKIIRIIKIIIIIITIFIIIHEFLGIRLLHQALNAEIDLSFVFIGQRAVIFRIFPINAIEFRILSHGFRVMQRQLAQIEHIFRVFIRVIAI